MYTGQLSKKLGSEKQVLLQYTSYRSRERHMGFGGWEQRVSRKVFHLIGQAHFMGLSRCLGNVSHSNVYVFLVLSQCSPSNLPIHINFPTRKGNELILIGSGSFINIHPLANVNVVIMHLL